MKRRAEPTESVSVRLPISDIARLDYFAAEENRSRASLFVHIVRGWMAIRKDPIPKPMKRVKERQYDER